MEISINGFGRKRNNLRRALEKGLSKKAFGDQPWVTVEGGPVRSDSPTFTIEAKPEETKHVFKALRILKRELRGYPEVTFAAQFLLTFSYDFKKERPDKSSKLKKRKKRKKS